MTDERPGARRPLTEVRWSVLDGDPDSRDAARVGQREAEEMSEAPDAFVASVARTLRRPVRLDPALDDRIMAAVAAEGRPAARPVDVEVAAGGWAGARAWRWLRRPRTVRVTPLGGLAGMAGLAAAAALAVVVARQSPAIGVAAASIDSATPAVVRSTGVRTRPSITSSKVVGSMAGMS